VKGRTILVIAFQILGAVVGSIVFFGGLFAFDYRVGIAAVGGVVALAALFTDDRTPR